VLFCSQAYLFFFAAVFTLYWAARWHRARIAILLVAGFCFYASWSGWLALLVFAGSFLDYLVGRGLESCSRPRRRRLLLAISLSANLGLLFYFKYANFFLRSLEDGLRMFGGEASLPVLSVILPIGISFYTFEAISYTIDVYHRRIPAERNLAHFFLFITFFPHLVAGPIVRARDFLPQLRRKKRHTWLRLRVGVQLFLLGLFKKIAIADRMAFFVDPVFAEPALYGSAATWLASLAYALQIYCDFSGYSDMAIGSAHMLGFKLAPNFDMPYLAANVSEFWRRWHISLSSWLRDYLFIPLGGSRLGRWQTNRNLLITMTLGGLWHGASWTFVVWGVVHGCLLILHREFRSWSEARPRIGDVLSSAAGTLARVAATFLAVTLCWVLFRATTIQAAATIFAHLCWPTEGLSLALPAGSLLVLLGAVVLVHVAVRLAGKPGPLLERLPAPVLGLGYAVLLTLALLLSPGSEKAFIYFQF
jgi:alginate O-acetyltransferase complex protein AlgI